LPAVRPLSIFRRSLMMAAARHVIVENKPGASGAIGTDVVAKSAPAGYNIVISDLAPVGLLTSSPYYVTVRARGPRALGQAGVRDQHVKVEQ
jgi:hypothetical protein